MLADAGCVPDQIILDGNHDYFGRPDQVRTVIDGDALCLSVAAASIVAKVTRDRIMAAESECYPGYDFESNRGYRSYRHRCALLGYGPTAIHRRSWVCMENLPWTQRGAGPDALPLMPDRTPGADVPGLGRRGVHRVPHRIQPPHPEGL